MKTLFKRLGLAVLRGVFGVKLVDQRTGGIIGKIVVLRWKGKLRILGLDGVAVRPHFLPQATEVYWAQDLGFSTHPPPDYPHVADNYRLDLASIAKRGGSDVPDLAAPEP